MSEFNVGDRVHLSNGGCTFTAYGDFFKENGFEFYRRNWAEGKLTPVGDYTVVATGKHSDCYHYSPLYLLRSDDGKIYIAHNSRGYLTLVEKEESKVIYASELMELARKDPGRYEGKRYKVAKGSNMWSGNQRYSECRVYSGTICTINCAINLSVYADTQLEEILPEPKPVTFMEAAEAYEKGKAVECKIHACSNIYELKMTSGMIDQNGRAVSANEILHGTWYIVGR